MSPIEFIFKLTVIITMGMGLIISGMALSPDDSFGVRKLLKNFKKHPTKS